MMDLLSMVALNPELSLAIVGILLDLAAGWLPDSVTKYPGAILTVANKMYYNGKEGRPELAAKPDPEEIMLRTIETMTQRIIRDELAKYAKPRRT